MCLYLDKIYKFITSLCYKNEYTEYEKIKKDLVDPLPGPQNDYIDRPFIVNIPPSVGDFSNDDNGIISLDNTVPSETCPENDWDVVKCETPSP